MTKASLLNFPSKGIETYLKDSEGQTQYNEPLGLLYLAAHLREAEIGTSIFDLNTRVGSFRAKSTDEFLERVVEDLLSESPDVIGVATFTAFMNEGLGIAQKVKSRSPTTKVVFGGPHATFLDAQGVNEGFVDAVVRHEGETSFLQLIRAFENRTPLSDVRGITYSNNGQLTRNPSMPFIQDLDALPHPARDMISSDYYTRGKRMNICSARGCPSACTYCVSPTMWNRTVRFRSAKNIDDEINLFMEMYGSQLPEGFHINFVDDTFALKPARIHEVSEMMKDHNIPWFINTTVNTAKREYLEAMRNGGCTKIKFGLESANQRVLDLVQKRQTVPMMRDAVVLSKELGYITQGSFILGNPTETEEEVRNTIAFTKTIPLDFAFFFISTPYPGTQMSQTYVPSNVDVLTNVEKFNPSSNFYGDSDILTPLRKRELLAEAYHEFYVVHKGLDPGPSYSMLSDPLERVAQIQSRAHVLHQRLGSYSGITNFLGRTGSDVPFRNA